MPPGLWAKTLLRQLFFLLLTGVLYRDLLYKVECLIGTSNTEKNHISIREILRLFSTCV